MIRYLTGDCRQILTTLPDSSVNCCVTSPPYWGLRDYDVAGQLGLEATFDEHVEQLVAVFREVRRVLHDDGTLWLNLGDAYAQGKIGRSDEDEDSLRRRHQRWGTARRAKSGERGARSGQPRPMPLNLKPKDLIGMPWWIAFALRADGWYLRSDIIWHKPNPMPESVYDRPTKAHEYVFLFSKSRHYYYDHEAILEPVSLNTHARLSQDVQLQKGSSRAYGGQGKAMKAVGRKATKVPTGWQTGSGSHSGKVGRYKVKQNESFDHAMAVMSTTRNKRSVWTVGSQPFKGAHFATYPPELIRPCIRAGCPAGGTVLDPFGGSGTSALVAEQEGRNAILIELNPEYMNIAKERTQQRSLLASAA